MASIKKLGNQFYVYYYHPLRRKPNGKLEQLYEKFYDEQSATKRKNEIEHQFKNGDYKVPSNMTIEDYFKQKFVPIYAVSKWKYRTYDTNMSYWNNDILPYFGSKRISKIAPAEIERFLLVMRSKKVRNMKNTPEEERPYLSETTIRYIYTLVHCFFKKAVQWEEIDKSPVKSDKPGTSNVKRNFWQPEDFDEALNSVDDELLHLAIQIAFRCTLRIGEVCALDWNRINYEASTIHIDRTLQRVSLDALNQIPSKEIFRIFPCIRKDSKSRLILTTPKSDYGVRSNNMFEQLCEELKRRELKTAMNKIRHGKNYKDNNLVFCYDDGHPIEPGRLTRRFAKWQAQHGIGEIGSVDFHSIRVSSASLKLAVSGGDIKSTQKDLGDKTTHMVLSTYARSLNEQHKAMNDKFDEYFYGSSQKEFNIPNDNQLLYSKMIEHLKQPEFLNKLLNELNPA